MKTLTGPFLVLPFMATPPLPPISPNCQEHSLGLQLCNFLTSLLRAVSVLILCEPRQPLLYSLWGSSLPTRAWGGLSINGWRATGPSDPPCKENPLHSISKCPPWACYPSIALLYCRMWLPTETTLSRLVMKHVCFSPSVTPHRLGRAVAGAAQKEDCLSHPGGSLRICKVGHILRQGMKNISDLEKNLLPHFTQCNYTNKTFYFYKVSRLTFPTTTGNKHD